MKNILKWIAIVFGATILLALLINVFSDDQETQAETKKEVVANKPTKSNWTYFNDADKMDNTPRYFANLTSSNKVNFSFPYSGGSEFRLTIRNMGYGNEVLIRVSSGQFIYDALDRVSIRAKFDDNAPVTYGYQTPSDGSMDMIFIDDAESFISNLKSAEKLLVEATFYNDGKKHIEFDVAGLEWEH